MALRSVLPVFAAMLAGVTGAQQVAPAPETSAATLVRLEAKDGRTHFQLGDVITVELVFRDPAFVAAAEPVGLTPLERARRPLPPGQHSVNDEGYPDLADSVTITPSEGVFHWQGTSGHDYMSASPLTREEIRVPLVLNLGYIFREPGHYEISVTTHRIDDGKPVATNQVGIDISARTGDEERALVRSLDAQVAGPSGDLRQSAAEKLASLPGDDAVRAKVRWLLAATAEDTAADYDDIERTMIDGLAASHNYDLQLQLLEAAWRDPARVPDSELLSAIAATRMFQAGKTEAAFVMWGPASPPDSDAQRMAEERRADLRAIADSLPQRTGANRSETAYFLIENAGGDPALAAAARPVAVAEFRNMDPLRQAMLLETAWERVRDPGLIPGLVAMLDAPQQEYGYGEPLERLLELDPARAKPYVVREICNPQSHVQMKQMAALPDATLPQTDACLLEQIRANAARNGILGGAPWPEKAQVAARFASAAIYPGVLALYRMHPEWDEALRGAVIAYLVRWHPETATELIPVASLATFTQVRYGFENVLKERHASYPEPLRLALRAQLAKGSDVEAGNALGILAQFGREDDATVALARLDRVTAEWSGREAEMLDPNASAAAKAAYQLRRELVFKLLAKDGTWDLPEGERQRIRQLCVGEDCARVLAWIQ